MKLRCLAVITSVITAGLIAVPGNAACTVGKIAELPVTMSGLRPTVPVTINGSETRLIADSGAFYSFLSPGSAAQFGLKLVALPPQIQVRGYNGDVKTSLVTVKTLVLAGQTLHNLDFVVGGSEFGTAGLLGQNILGIADVEYDLPDGVIRLMEAHGCGGANLAYWANGKPFSMLSIDAARPGGHITGTIELNGTKLRATFDTGAPTSVLSLTAAARLGIKPGGAGVVEAGYSGGGGRNLVKTWIAAFDSLKIGDNETIQKIRLRFGAGYAGDDVDMLIGADFFLSHRVYVANSQHKLFFSYTGGPVFNLGMGGVPAAATGSSVAANGPDPTDADGFSRRAQVSAARRDYDQAIADLTRAIALAPKEPRYVYQRGLAYLGARRSELAMADVDQGLKLKPDDVDLLLLRVKLRFQTGNLAAAADLVVTDLQAADHAAAPQADSRVAIGLAYSILVEEVRKIDLFDPAVAQYDLWLKYHPDDERVPEQLNGRCFLRAVANRELDQALADCNRSLRMRPKTAATLDSRGFLQLRRGALDLAIADYDAALAIEPKLAVSLYGRGIAKRRKGETAAGDADIVAAVAIAPSIAKRFSAYGITPTGGATTTTSSH